jgi:hypothetical protein
MNPLITQRSPKRGLSNKRQTSLLTPRNPPQKKVKYMKLLTLLPFRHLSLLGTTYPHDDVYAPSCACFRG